MRNLSVARSVAFRYRRSGVSDEDLQHVAYLGLVKAVEAFDPAVERDLLAYAVPVIRAEMARHLRDHGREVRTPVVELLGAPEHGPALIEARMLRSPAMVRMSQRDRDILFLRFNRGQSLTQIGRRVGLSGMQVSSLISQILRQLQTSAD